MSFTFNLNELDDINPAIKTEQLFENMSHNQLRVTIKDIQYVIIFNFF